MQGLSYALAQLVYSRIQFVQGDFLHACVF